MVMKLVFDVPDPWGGVLKGFPGVPLVKTMNNSFDFNVIQK